MHLVLWALDNELEDREFERLCTDLMHHAGYRQINPLGGSHDGGRDAELRPGFMGLDPSGATVFFQYSQDTQWERKLKKELKKVHSRGHSIKTFVFVTSRSVSGSKQETLRAKTQEEYGWNLVIYHRECLGCTRNRKAAPAPTV